MKLFEYQAKEAFREKGLPTPKGVLVRGMDELDGAFAEVGFPCVLKSQVLSGGRGKAGLIKVVKDAESAKPPPRPCSNPNTTSVCSSLKRPWTSTAKSTSPSPWTRWNPKSCLSAAPKAAWKSKSSPPPIPTRSLPCAWTSPKGSAATTSTTSPYGMGLSGDLGKQVGAVVRGLYKTFRAYDAQLAEINPLFITKDGKAIAGDGKLIIDDNSVWRQPATPLPATTSTPKSNSKPRRKASPTSSSTGDIA